MKKIDLAYLAGIVDGEGCIYIAKQRVNVLDHGSMSLRVEITQKDFELLKEIISMVKKKHGVRKFNPITHRAHTLVYSNKQAYWFIKKIYPYLKAKKEQARVAIQFYENYRVPAGSYLVKMAGKKLYEYDSDLWAKREGCFHALKWLKRKTVISFI